MTPSYRVLQCFGRVLRNGRLEDLYRFSKAAPKIKEFVSHNWHGSAWKKIAMLFVLKNGLAAVLVGSLFAFIMVILSSLGLLPGYSREPLNEPGRTYIFAPWGTCVGMLMMSLVFISMRNFDPVFLDRICIHQTDPRKKFEGVINICAFLKNSESLLVLWDASYVERLWCLVELSAYMKSCDDGAKKMNLVIKPTILGPSSILACFGVFAVQISQTAVPWADRFQGFFIWSMICCFFLFSAVYMLRTYYQQIDRMKVQLQNFSIDETKAHCCQIGHIDRNGGHVPCDKEAIVECVRHWFGSVEEYERTVRTNVAVALTQNLGNLVFPYKYLLAAGAPSLWSQADYVASRLREGEYYYAGVTAVFGLAYWFAAIPFIFASGALLNYRLRHKYHPCLDPLMTFISTAFLILVPGGGLYILQTLGAARSQDFSFFLQAFQEESD